MAQSVVGMDFADDDGGKANQGQRPAEIIDLSQNCHFLVLCTLLKGKVWLGFGKIEGAEALQIGGGTFPYLLNCPRGTVRTRWLPRPHPLACRIEGVEGFLGCLIR